MISKFLRRSEGTIILHRGAWAYGSTYSSWNVVTNGGMSYYCKLGHIAYSSTEPGSGASWTTYWEQWGPAGNVWGNRALNVIFDGGGVTLVTGIKAMVEVPFAMRITSGKLFSLDGTSGSIFVDLWADSYANFPPTVADKIQTFYFSNTTKSSTSVNLPLTAGDIILFYVSSVTSIKLACLSLMLGTL